MTDNFSHGWESGTRHGRWRERKSIADWLREFGNHEPAPDCRRCEIADQIEAGAHLPDTAEG